MWLEAILTILIFVLITLLIKRKSETSFGSRAIRTVECDTYCSLLNDMEGNTCGDKSCVCQSDYCKNQFKRPASEGEPMDYVNSCFPDCEIGKQDLLNVCGKNNLVKLINAECEMNDNNQAGCAEACISLADSQCDVEWCVQNNPVLCKECSLTDTRGCTPEELACLIDDACSSSVNQSCDKILKRLNTRTTKQKR